ncbi:GntR family transcriptional regulator [Brucella gallinifaecis]|uniref:GntR family transcriptional regulator n=2 Tax=Brucella gallinifaecis TaxID=215590 RepID=A0A502BTN4_9HYPH|nr:GntR family transcriptional regulator [Brucella gallinifaecis]
MLKDAAYERVEALLNEGALKPGQLVSQRELVSMTGTTLGSIREAISRLQTEGLLIALPKRGLMVPSMDVQFVRNAYQLRKVLELGAIRSAMTHLEKDVFAGWIRKHEEMRDFTSAQSQQHANELQALDWTIHHRLISSMQNELILNTYRVNAIKIRMAVQTRLRVTPFNAKRVAGEHLAFLKPMFEGNIDKATIALNTHIENSLTLALGGEITDNPE